MTFFDRQTFNQDHFAIFGLPRRQALDAEALERMYQDLQTRLHPDKHAHLGESERRLSMQWASRVNEGYQILKSPLSRARYLLELAGAGVDVERNTAMSAEFLMDQMARREAVAEAREAGDIDLLDDLARQARQNMAEPYRQLMTSLDEQQDYQRAAELVRQLLFQEKLLHDIDEAIQAVDA